MTKSAAGMARKLLLAVCFGTLLALCSCAAGGPGLTKSPGGRSALAAPRLSKAGLSGKQVAGAPLGLRLIWGFVDDPTVVGYYLYRDIQSIPDPGPDGFIDPLLRVNDGNAIAQPGAGPDVVFDDIFEAEIGTTYYYRVTVLDDQDQESYPSNEISWTVHGHNVATLSPTEAYYGDQVTVTGDTFGTFDALSDKVFFTALSGPPLEGNVISWTDTEIVAEVPVGAFDGPVSISIDSTFAESDDDLIILNPIITQIDPNQQFASGNLVIDGFNFGATQSDSAILVGGQNCISGVLAWSDSQITLGLPADVADGDVVVVVLSVQSNALPFQVLPRLESVDILSPQSGEVLTLTGNNFDAAPGKVYIDGNVEQAVGNWADDEVTFTLDAATTGQHVIKLEDAAGLQSNELAIEVVAPLTVTVVGLTPSQLYRVSDAPSLVLTGSTAADADVVDLFVDGNLVSSSITAPFDDLTLDLAPLTNGTHEISMQARRRQVTVDSLEIPFDVYSLVGDIDGSGVVDASDRDALAPLIGLLDSDGAFRAWFDPSEDGIVNEADLSGIGYRFGNLIPDSV